MAHYTIWKILIRHHYIHILKHVGTKMETANKYFLNKFTDVLGLLVRQREVLSNDGYEMISTIIYWKYNEIHEGCTTKSNLKTTRGEAFYGDRKIKCIHVNNTRVTEDVITCNNTEYSSHKPEEVVDGKHKND